jgi:hypothetical protein
VGVWIRFYLTLSSLLLLHNTLTPSESGLRFGYRRKYNDITKQIESFLLTCITHTFTHTHPQSYCIIKQYRLWLLFLIFKCWKLWAPWFPFCLLPHLWSTIIGSPCEGRTSLGSPFLAPKPFLQLLGRFSMPAPRKTTVQVINLFKISCCVCNIICLYVQIKSGVENLFSCCGWPQHFPQQCRLLKNGHCYWGSSFFALTCSLDLLPIDTLVTFISAAP